jgi:hypothetical protein
MKTPTLPRAYVHHGWPVARTLLVGLVMVCAAALAALGVKSYLDMIEDFETYKAEQAAARAQERIEIAFVDGGVVCKVPPKDTDVAPVVHGACQALAVQLHRVRGGK